MQAGQIPLVSIIVVTYNSSAFVLETLESAKWQTYRNIELIVADDCSSDSTVTIVQKWMEENAKYFVSVKLVPAEENSGIPANCNRGLNVSTGEWIKLIAGDDILKEDCIETFLNYIQSRKDEDVKAVFGQQQVFTDVFDPENFTRISPLDDGHAIFSNKSSAREQYESFIRVEKYLTAPTLFFQRKMLIELGGFLEKYRMLEDYPLYFRITEKGIKIHFVEEVTVYYRIHSNSVLRKDLNKKVVSDLKICWDAFFLDYVYPRTSLLRKINILWMVGITRLILLLGNKGTFAEKLSWFGVTFQPVRLLWIKRQFSRILN